MKKILFLICFFPFYLLSQISDTSYTEYIELGDKEYLKDEFSLDALDFYIKAINKADIINLNESAYPKLMKTAERSAEIYYFYDFYTDALSLYRLTLNFSRLLNDKSTTHSTIPKIAKIYHEMRKSGIAPPNVNAESFETVEIFYRIINNPIIKDGILYLKINGGLSDGIYEASVGNIYGTYSKEFKNREYALLGNAVVEKIDSNETLLKVTPMYTQEGFHEIVLGDMAMILTRIPKKSYNSTLWELSKMHIIFHNNYNKPIYDFRQLLYDDSKELESEILEIMSKDVYETWEMLRDTKDKSSQKSVFEDTLDDGKYKGKTVYDIMGQTTKDDIQSFLGFVKVFPGKYMGSTWKINETYATWLLNNSPIGFDEFFEIFMNAQTTEDYKDIISKYYKAITEDEFLKRLNIETEKKCEEKKYDEAFNIVYKSLKLSSFIEDKSHMAWVYFTLGRIYDNKNEIDSTRYYYETALLIFNETEDIKGRAVCLNNLGILKQDAHEYTTALTYFTQSLNYKINYINHEDFDRANDYLSIAKGEFSIGWSNYKLANYDTALSSYHKALLWCDSAKSLEAKRFTGDVYTEIARVYKKRGEFDHALEIYEKQLKEFKEINEPSKIADTYDYIADIHFIMGNYRLAFNTFYGAYHIKISLKDWNEAGFSLSNCGQALWNIGNLDSALICHNLALELRKKGDNKSGQIYSLGKIAELFKKTGQPEKAEAYFQQAYDLSRELGDSLKIASITNDIGSFYSELKNYSVASEFYNYSLNIYKNKELKSELAEVLNNMGGLYMKLKNYNEAEKYYSESLSLRKEINEKQNIMYSLVDYGFLLLYKKFLTDTALTMLKEALVLAQETGSEDYIAYCHQSIGTAYTFNSETKSAEESYLKALEIYKKTGDVSGQCEMLRYLGINEMNRGNFSKAYKLYDEVIQLANNNNLQIELAAAYNNLTEYYYYTGEFSKAFSVIDSAYKIFEENNNLYGVANTHIVNGNTHNLIGNAPEAMLKYKEADSIYRSLEDPLSSATALNNMGTIAFMLGNYEECLKLFNRALQILDSVIIDVSLKTTVTCNIGEVYMERNIWEEAENYFNMSLKMAEKTGETRMAWNSKTMMGKLKSKQGKYDLSNKIITECYNAYLKSDEKMAIAECATIMGKNNLALNKIENARENFSNALNIYRSINSRKMLWEPLYYLALVEEILNNNELAINYLKEAVENIESLSSEISGDNTYKKLFAKANNKIDIYQTLITLLVKEEKILDAWVYQEKLNVYGLTEQTRGEPTRGASIENDEKAILSELELKKEGIYNQLLLEKSKPQHERNTEKIIELEKLMTIAGNNYQNFFWELVEKGDINNNFANTVNPEELDQKRFNMENDIIILQYLVTKEKTIIFIASSDTLEAKIIDISQSNIEKYVTNYYNMLTGMDTIEKIHKASEQLYKVLIEPVFNLISNKKNIAIVPGGMLMKVPYQSLGFYKENQFNYFGSSFNVFYINDMNNTVVDEPLDIKNASWLAFGNADNTLPYAEKEINDISTFFNEPSIYLKKDALEDIAKNNMNKYQIVHFATHGTLDPVKFSNSFLTLAPNNELGEDGMLTMSEINRIRTLKNCQIIVLSACNTAVNDKNLEGWINNPAKAFLRKGAKTSIASLWAVDDAATGELMNKFYTYLFEGYNKIEALTMAQKFLINSEKFKHPYYWSAFELIGQWK